MIHPTANPPEILGRKRTPTIELFRETEVALIVVCPFVSYNQPTNQKVIPMGFKGFRKFEKVDNALLGVEMSEVKPNKDGKGSHFTARVKPYPVGDVVVRNFFSNKEENGTENWRMMDPQTFAAYISEEMDMSNQFSIKIVDVKPKVVVIEGASHLITQVRILIGHNEKLGAVVRQYGYELPSADDDSDPHTPGASENGPSIKKGAEVDAEKK